MWARVLFRRPKESSTSSRGRRLRTPWDVQAWSCVATVDPWSPTRSCSDPLGKSGGVRASSSKRGPPDLASRSPLPLYPSIGTPLEGWNVVFGPEFVDCFSVAILRRHGFRFWWFTTTPLQAAIDRPRSLGLAPIARSDLKSRSIETDASPLSIFATRD